MLNFWVHIDCVVNFWGWILLKWYTKLGFPVVLYPINRFHWINFAVYHCEVLIFKIFDFNSKFLKCQILYLKGEVLCECTFNRWILTIWNVAIVWTFRVTIVVLLILRHLDRKHPIILMEKAMYRQKTWLMKPINYVIWRCAWNTICFVCSISNISVNKSRAG